jgi:hypothetical protein
MSYTKSALQILLCLIALPCKAGQSTQASAPNATALLQSSLLALSGGHPLTDVTLSGTAQRIAGSDDESGTVVIKALAGIGSRMDLTFPSGARSEIRNTSAGPAGSWSGPDGVAHAMAYHNLLTDPAWSPALAIAAALSAPNAIITFIGTETRNEQSVIHISASQQFPNASTDGSVLMQHLTKTEIFLDPGTSLPVSILFNTHADTNALLDIPIEIQFSSYTAVGGAEIPFRVQRFLDNSLTLDLQFSSATLNSGVSPSIFATGGAQ